MNNQLKNIFLQAAAHGGDFDKVQKLVEQGADIHADKNRALKWAVESRHHEIANYLKRQMIKQKLTANE